MVPQTKQFQFEKRRASDNTLRMEERLKLEDDYFKDLYENKKGKNHNASILTANQNSSHPSKKLHNYYGNNQGSSGSNLGSTTNQNSRKTLGFKQAIQSI